MIDTKTQVWLDVSAWAERRLAQHREMIDSPNTSQDKTQFLRGQILEIKALLALPAEQQQPTLAPLYGDALVE